MATAIAAPAVLRSIDTWQRQGQVEGLLDQIRGLPASARAQGREVLVSAESLASKSPPLRAEPGSRITTAKSWRIRHNGVCDSGSVQLEGTGSPIRIEVKAPFCDPQVVTE